MLSPPLSACGCHNIVFHLSCLIYFMGFLSQAWRVFLFQAYLCGGLYVFFMDWWAVRVFCLNCLQFSES